MNLCHFEYLSLLHFSLTEKTGDNDKGAIISKPQFSKIKCRVSTKESFANTSLTAKNQKKQD